MFRPTTPDSILYVKVEKRFSRHDDDTKARKMKAESSAGRAEASGLAMYEFRAELC